MKMDRLAIIGAGGHGKVVADAAELSGWADISFFDDYRPVGEIHLNWPIAGNLHDFLQNHSHFDAAIVAIGDNQSRFDVCQKLLGLSIRLVSIIHPQAIVSRYAQIGVGSVVFAGAIINPDTKIGMATIINTNACVEHDCDLGSAVHISPGAHLAGSVTLGNLSWVGIGASVRNNIVIGPKAIIGAGAAVVSNVAAGITVMGVPAVAYFRDRP